MTISVVVDAKSITVSTLCHNTKNTNFNIHSSMRACKRASAKTYIHTRDGDNGDTEFSYDRLNHTVTLGP